MKRSAKTTLGLAGAAAILGLATASASPSDQPIDEPIGHTETEPIHVVGGSPVPDGKWQDTAGIVFGNQVGCTGVLIAPDLVLTAAHCVDNSLSHVLLGVNDLRKQGELIPVQQRLVYPNPYSSYDVAVLVLSQPSTVAPRTIATGCILERYLQNGSNVAIVGYGATDANASQYRDELMEAYTTVTDYDCSNLSKGCEPNVSPGGELGAGGNGIDSCNGDSGGPLYLVTPRGEYLIGTTSRAYSDATQYCSQGGIYVRSDAIFDWVEQTTGRTLPRATCNAAPAPSAPAIEVEAGDTGSTTVAPNDPDTEDTHTFALATAPQHGTVTVHDDGRVDYHAAADYDGPDSFVIAVTDNGDPAETTEIRVEVTVLPASGCGCQSSTPTTGGLLLLLAVTALLLRRRPTQARIRPRHR